MVLARVALAAILAALAACSGEGGSKLRDATYGPDFEYISKEQLESTMWRLARDAKELDQLAAKPDPLSEADRALVLRLLTSMDDGAERLGAEGKRTNHPMLDERRDQFRADLEAARRGVASEPPNYTLARTVSTACTRCHHQSVR